VKLYRTLAGFFGPITFCNRAFAFSFAAGFLLSLPLSITAATHYVDISNPAPSVPYTNWLTAATNIQDAVDAANAGDEVVVTNGQYQTGGRLVNGWAITNRVAVTKAITVRSVNGPAVTVIQGYQVPGTTNGDSAIRCVYLAAGAVLAGFTLTNGATRFPGDVYMEESGGGVWCATLSAVVSNCVVAGNSADFYGGGAYSGTLFNCMLTGNSAPYGGGADSSTLNNCVLTGNLAAYGGGADVATLSNCTLAGNSASDYGGGVYGGKLTNCTLTGNSASFGGGASAGSLIDCTLADNSVSQNGGGASGGTLTNCTLTGNSAFQNGGGAVGGALYNCVLTNNHAAYGGGASQGTLNHCMLTANRALYDGGGAYASTLNNCTLKGNSSTTTGGGATSSTLNNCALTGNSVSGYGGGAQSSTMNNCTVAGNWASAGGGAYESTLYNCIAYYNQSLAEPNYDSGSALYYCCTTPLPPSGTGNLDADPQLANLSHLSAGSPCCGVGSTNYAAGVDMDGEPWANPPSIGCDELYLGSMTGSVSLAIFALYTNVVAGFGIPFIADISGPVGASTWDFGDGTVVSNRPYASHTWTTTGDYSVVLRAYNDTYPGGVSATTLVHVVSQPVHYVSLSSPGPRVPYTSWETAATNIQDAVDAASIAGALVLVSNGVYGVGGRVVSGALSNRVAVTQPLILQSVNGSAVTAIQGYQVPGTINDDGAVRCVYLTDGAVLTGFTVTNGATRNAGDPFLEANGGGVWCSTPNTVVSNCMIIGNSAVNLGGGVAGGTLKNCTLATNSAIYGGGVFGGILNYCTLTGNSGGSGGGAYDAALNNCVLTENAADAGGGAYIGTLNNCSLTANSGGSTGGGAYGAVLNNCTLTANSAPFGGGVTDGTLHNCTLTANSSSTSGGGANSATLNGCVLTGNSAPTGGGAYSAALNNCTLTGNSAILEGGGAVSSTLNNCIVYYNQAPVSPNYKAGSLSYCCTTPLPSSGLANLGAEPQLASLSHLSASSPCRGAGSAANATGVDIDDEPWANPPSIGCDEYYAGSVTGALSVALQATYTNVTPGFVVSFTANITGRLTASAWDFGDGTVVSNRPYASHAWAAPGDYAVELRAYNETYPAGLSGKLLVHVVTQPVHYVSLDSPGSLAPYTTWATAATNIQDAVDAASVAGALVLVSNGVYGLGGRVRSGALTNRLAVTGPLIVQSVNGATVTIIQGHQASGTTNGDSAVRCALLANGAVLAGFTLTNGATRAAGDLYVERSGGGVWCQTLSEVISNCVIAGNSASFGGGAYYGTLHDCLVAGNSAASGGGAYYGTLVSCTLTNNSATYGGGTQGCGLTQCLLAGNSASQYGGGASDGTLIDCVVTNNWAATSGGGASSCTLTNSLLAGNSALRYGGGAYQGSLNSCLLRGNWARQNGGGAFSAIMTNCILTGNSATNLGGGVFGGTLYNCTLTGNSSRTAGGGLCGGSQWNCIVYYNQAPSYQNYEDGYMKYCCTTPRLNLAGNITNAPLFLDQAGGNLRLQATSPCINAGTNSPGAGSADLDGRPRIVGSRIDMGAYEFQGPGMSEFIGWLQQYGLPADGSADYTDADSDRMSNWQEWVAGTDPTNSASLLQLLPPVVLPPALLLRWNSDASHTYFIERATGLGTPAAFSLLQTNVPGLDGTTIFSHTTWDAAAFYRVGTDSGGIAPLWLEVPQLLPANATVFWTSVTNRSYVVERSTSLLAPMLFSPVATNIPGQAGTTSYTDTSASGAGPFLYRVRVQ
jgi:parallel beta-helix repeat protein